MRFCLFFRIHLFTEVAVVLFCTKVLRSCLFFRIHPFTEVAVVLFCTEVTRFCLFYRIHPFTEVVVMLFWGDEVLFVFPDPPVHWGGCYVVLRWWGFVCFSGSPCSHGISVLYMAIRPNPLTFSPACYIIHWSGATPALLRSTGCPPSTKRLPGVVLMLGHRLRRWPNIETTPGNHLVCVGIAHLYTLCIRQAW